MLETLMLRGHRKEPCSHRTWRKGTATGASLAPDSLEPALPALLGRDGVSDVHFPMFRRNPGFHTEYQD